MKTQLFKERLGSQSPEILVAVGIFSSISSVIFAIRNTATAIKKLEEQDISIVDFRDRVKICWKIYLPTIVMVMINISSLIGIFKIMSVRLGISAGLYLVAVEALREYQEQVMLQLGEKKHESLLDRIDEEHLKKHPLSSGSDVIVIGTGNVLFYDSYSGRYFTSTIETVKGAVNDFNYRLLTEMFLSLNDFYYDIGLEPIEAGDGQGWGIENRLEVRFGAQIANAPQTKWDNQPCIVLSYEVLPHYL